MSTVIFDAGPTLLRATPTFLHVFAAGAARAGAKLDPDTIDLHPDEFERVWREHTERWELEGWGSPHLGDEVTERRFWQGLYGAFLDHLGLLSNWGPSLRSLLAAKGLLRRFDAVVISGEEGVEKPDRAAFDRTLDRLGELPGPHVAYVGVRSHR